MTDPSELDMLNTRRLEPLHDKLNIRSKTVKVG